MLVRCINLFTCNMRRGFVCIVERIAKNQESLWVTQEHSRPHNNSSGPSACCANDLPCAPADESFVTKLSNELLKLVRTRRSPNRVLLAGKPKALEKIPPALDCLKSSFSSRSESSRKILMNRLEEFNGWRFKLIYIALALYLDNIFNCNVLMSRHELK